MKIEKFTKLKNGQYKLTLENKNELLLHEDLILKYELLLSKKLSTSVEEKILLENACYNAYNDAIKYLARRMRSQYEIYDYLKKKEYSHDIINKAIDMLISQKYIDDSMYTKAFINDKINLNNDGPNKIRRQLEEYHIKNEIINEYISLFTKKLQEEKIDKYITKQLAINKSKSRIILKNKIVNYLITQGYDSGLVINKANKIEVNDQELAKKEYEKLLKKLANKYQDPRELDMHIRQKMYQKGFTNYE